MFEKEAEKWTIDYVCKDCSRYKECKSKEHCTCKNCSKEKWQNGAEFGYNKSKEELNQNGLALQSDMDKTIEQNIALKKELNNVKEWHNLQENPTDLPKCEENEQIIFYVNEWFESIKKYRTHYCLGFYKKAFLIKDVKVFVEKSRGYENEHLPKSVLRWRELEKWESK